MKKSLLILAAGMISATSFAQQIQDDLVPKTFSTVSATDNFNLFQSGTAQKSTGLTDTLIYANAGQTGGPYSGAFMDIVTPVDSGRFFGMNVLGYKAFAQLYRFSNIDRATPVDTTYNIYGVYALFVGTGVSASKNVTISLWKRDAVKYAIPGRPKFFVYGVPMSSPVAGGTKTVSFTALTLNSLTRYFFSAPITGVNYDVYAGYSLPSYSWSALGGDTVGLATSANTNGGTYVLETGTLDTLVSTNTLLMNSLNSWKSPGFELGRSGDLVLFPIIKLSCPLCGTGGVSVKGFTQNNLTFFGNYPNPAVDYTNIKISLKTGTDVTVTVTDIAGRNIQTIEQSGLSAGEHLIKLNTSALAAGSYTYLVRTSNGDGIASQFTVSK